MSDDVPDGWQRIEIDGKDVLIRVSRFCCSQCDFTSTDLGAFKSHLADNAHHTLFVSRRSRL